MEAKFCKISELAENLLTYDSHSLNILKSLEGLIEKPCQVSHFRQKKGLINLMKFIDVPDCQEIALSLLGNCCVEEESCLFIINSQQLSKLEILYESEKRCRKYLIRLFGLMCLQKSCFNHVVNINDLDSLVFVLDEKGLDERFLHDHLKTIRLRGNDKYSHDELMYYGVTTKLSQLLIRPLSHNLAKEILQLIHYYLKQPGIDESESDKCLLTIKELVKVVKEKGKLSDRVYKFILHHIVPIENLCHYVTFGGVLYLLIDKLKGSQCCKEKQELLHFMHIIASNSGKLDLFEPEGWYEMLVECLNDPFLRPSFSTIFNILFFYCTTSYKYEMDDYSEDISYLVSFCFKIINESNFFQLSKITSILLDAEEDKLLRGDADGMELNPPDNLVVSNSGRVDITDEELPAERKELNLEDHLGKITLKDQISKEKRESKKIFTLALEFLNGIALTHQHLISPQRFYTLIDAIATSPDDKNLHKILFRLIESPPFFKMSIQMSILPKVDLITKLYPNEKLSSFFTQLKNLLCTKSLCFCDIESFNLNTKLTVVCAQCYVLENHVHKFLSKYRVNFYAVLVSCMYARQHPLRLLAITSYCNLLSSVEDSCECEADECDIEEKEELAESDYDVSFVVGEECVRSVRSRLMQHSDVFTAMFNGVYSEASSAHVVVIDTSPEAFQVFNNSLLSGRFKCDLFDNLSCDLMVQVLQLANKYLVRRLEWQIVRLICSNLSAYLDAILASNFFIANRHLLICCLLKVCKNISCPSSITPFIPHTFQQFTKMLSVLSQQELTDISSELFKSVCIHQV